MPNNSPIIIIEDDMDDQLILTEIFEALALNNSILFFPDTRSAKKYLLISDQPFLIICDINLPAQNGVEFKREIDRDPVLRKKSIPFVFLTTYAQDSAIKTAYEELTVQGFFMKPPVFADFKLLIQHLVAYWQVCRHPND